MTSPAEKLRQAGEQRSFTVTTYENVLVKREVQVKATGYNIDHETGRLHLVHATGEMVQGFLGGMVEVVKDVATFEKGHWVRVTCDQDTLRDEAINVNPITTPTPTKH